MFPRMFPRALSGDNEVRTMTGLPEPGLELAHKKSFLLPTDAWSVLNLCLCAQLQLRSLQKKHPHGDAGDGLVTEC